MVGSFSFFICEVGGLDKVVLTKVLVCVDVGFCFEFFLL